MTDASTRLDTTEIKKDAVEDGQDACEPVTKFKIFLMSGGCQHMFVKAGNGRASDCMGREKAGPWLGSVANTTKIVVVDVSGGAYP